MKQEAKRKCATKTWSIVFGDIGLSYFQADTGKTSADPTQSRTNDTKSTKIQAIVGALAGFVFSKLWQIINSNAVVAFLQFDMILYLLHCFLGVLYVAFVIRIIPYVLVRLWGIAAKNKFASKKFFFVHMSHEYLIKTSNLLGSVICWAHFLKFWHLSTKSSPESSQHLVRFRPTPGFNDIRQTSLHIP